MISSSIEDLIIRTLHIFVKRQHYLQFFKVSYHLIKKPYHYNHLFPPPHQTFTNLCPQKPHSSPESLVRTGLIWPNSSFQKDMKFTGLSAGPQHSTLTESIIYMSMHTILTHGFFSIMEISLILR